MERLLHFRLLRFTQDTDFPVTLRVELEDSFGKFGRIEYTNFVVNADDAITSAIPKVCIRISCEGFVGHARHAFLQDSSSDGVAMNWRVRDALAPLIGTTFSYTDDSGSICSGQTGW